MERNQTSLCRQCGVVRNAEKESNALIDFSIEASRAVEPYFYRAPYGRKKPYTFQFAAAEYGLARDHCLLGDAPGLGKTCEAMLIDNAIRSKRTLVICPASLRLNWEREIHMWSTIDKPGVSVVQKGTDGISGVHDFLVTSYDLLRNTSIQDAILDFHWDHVIIDEGHYLKDPKGNKRTQFICATDGLPNVTGRFTLTSGTILPNQPIECFNIFRLIDWNAIDRMSLESFRREYYKEGGGFVRGPYFDKKLQANVWGMHWSNSVRNVPANLKDLQHRLRKSIMVRRLKEQVLHDLPKKQWHVFPIFSTPEIRKALKHPGWKTVEKLYEMDNHAFDVSIPIDGDISTARRLLGEAKAPMVADYIDDMFDSGIEKLVVVAWHKNVLKYLRKRLEKYQFVYMDGSTSTKNKQDAVDSFQNFRGIKVILGQMQSLGIGWTLAAAQDVVFAEPHWVPGMNDQMLDRIHRVGQSGSYVIGHVPIVPDTLDERILSTAIAKDKHIFRALDKLPVDSN